MLGILYLNIEEPPIRSLGMIETISKNSYECLQIYLPIVSCGPLADGSWWKGSDVSSDFPDKCSANVERKLLGFA